MTKKKTKLGQDLLKSMKEAVDAEKGDRFNKGKPRWRNFPMFLMEPLIEVGQAGELKYSTFNFLNGLSVNDTLDSLKRHLMAAESPYSPDIDPETGCDHLASVAWNALVALHMIKTRPDLDDRLKLKKRKKK
jgi:hypothetical protein